MTLVEIATMGLILGLGAMVQSAVGFGMALIAIPLLVLAGQPLPVAVALLLGAALVQTALGSYALRAHIRWRRAFSFAAIQWVALVAGVASMGLLVNSDPARIKQAIGLAVIIAVTLQRLLRPTPRDRLAAGWTLIAAGSAGFASGLVGMGGPPLVFFALAHRWSPDEFRAFLWSQFMLVLPVLASVLALRFGAQILIWFGIGVAMAPIVWAGSWLGQRVSARWDPSRLQTAAVVMLYALGLTSLIGPYL